MKFLLASLLVLIIAIQGEAQEFESLQCEFGQGAFLDLRCNDNNNSDPNDDRLEFTFDNNGISSMSAALTTPAGTTITGIVGTNFTSSPMGDSHTINGGIYRISIPSPNCAPATFSFVLTNTGETCGGTTELNLITGGSSFNCDGFIADVSPPVCINDNLRFTINTSGTGNASIEELPAGTQLSDGSSNQIGTSFNLQINTAYTLLVPSVGCDDIYFLLDGDCGTNTIAMADAAPVSIPTLSQWGIIILSLVMFVFSILFIRRSQETSCNQVNL